MTEDLEIVALGVFEITKAERGYIVIIPGAHPGNEPRVEIEQVTQNVAFASVLDNDSINHSN
ncbi:TRAM domain-containing protein [Haloterrigena turkmenica]|uniref:TRAM domain-containing protein n=1 Tax=Haloterrigena turkmenica TaxID=62320 RepID=UPI001CF7850A|nr:TRAM domain-containing protein [Haloterrigena turkmenica]